MKVGQPAECLCALPSSSSSHADVTWSISDGLGESVSADRGMQGISYPDHHGLYVFLADNADDLHQTSRIRFLTSSLQRYFTVECNARNVLGHTHQQAVIRLECKILAQEHNCRNKF